MQIKSTFPFRFTQSRMDKHRNIAEMEEEFIEYKNNNHFRQNLLLYCPLMFIGVECGTGLAFRPHCSVALWMMTWSPIISPLISYFVSSPCQIVSGAMCVASHAPDACSGGNVHGRVEFCGAADIGNAGRNISKFAATTPNVNTGRADGGDQSSARHGGVTCFPDPVP